MTQGHTTREINKAKISHKKVVCGKSGDWNIWHDKTPFWDEKITPKHVPWGRSCEAHSKSPLYTLLKEWSEVGLWYAENYDREGSLKWIK